jgi:hypothetical protein
MLTQNLKLGWKSGGVTFILTHIVTSAISWRSKGSIFDTATINFFLSRPRRLVLHFLPIQQLVFIPDQVMDAPQELIDLVVDLVSLGTYKARSRTLAACSLVCRRWTSRSRRHLFHRITLTKENMQLFDQLLHSPLSTIVPSAIPEVVFRISNSVDEHVEGIVPKIGALLTNVQCCWFYSTPALDESFGCELLSLVGASIPSIKNLHIEGLMLLDEGLDTVSFLSSFKSLISLLLQSNIVFSVVVPPPSILPPPHLTSLTIRDGQTHLLDWFTAAEPRLLVPNLVLCNLEERQFQSVSAYLKIAGGGLHTLTLNFWDALENADCQFLLDYPQV